jgi:hypothetical protein
MPGQFVLTPKKRMLRVGGSRVSRTGREESRPLSGPRQIAVRIMYKTPQRTSSAPSPIRNISPLNSSLPRTTELESIAGRSDSFRPEQPKRNKPAKHWGPTRASSIPRRLPPSPMMVFAVRIKHALNVAVQRSHDADAGKHRRAARRRDQDQRLSCWPAGQNVAACVRFITLR